MKKFLLFLFVLFILLAQQSIYLPFHYGLIDFAVPILFVLGLWCGPIKGLVYGFLIGLLQASFSGYMIGTFLFTRSLAGWGGGILRGLIVKDNPLAVAFSVFWVSLLTDAIFLLSSPHSISKFLTYSLIIKALSSSLFAGFFASILSRLYQD
ncbi:hypothetical protein H5T87_06170 [bacterium]|nr:hypothetical protein [bacterium]